MDNCIYKLRPLEKVHEEIVKIVVDWHRTSDPIFHKKSNNSIRAAHE